MTATEYLDGNWTMVTAEVNSARWLICGSDGEAILTCNRWNHSVPLSPADVAKYLIREHRKAVAVAMALSAYREALANEEDIEDGPAHPPRPNWAMKAGALFDEIMAKNKVQV